MLGATLSEVWNILKKNNFRFYFHLIIREMNQQTAKQAFSIEFELHINRQEVFRILGLCFSLFY